MSKDNLNLDDFNIDDEFNLSSDYNASDFTDIIISADDSLESILEKFSSMNTSPKEEIIKEAVIEEEVISQPEIPVAIEDPVPQVKKEQIAKVEPKKVKEKKAKKPKKEEIALEEGNIKKTSIRRWSNIKDSLTDSLADAWNMVRYEFIADPESFFRKLGFTFIEFFNKFMYWAARVSRYFLLPISLGLIIGVVMFLATHTLAIKVTMSDRLVGYIKSTEDYETALVGAEEILTNQIGEECLIDVVPQYELTMVKKNLVLDVVELEEQVALVSAESVGKNYGLFVDGTLIGTYTKESALIEMLDNIKAPYQTGVENESAVFVQEVEIIEGEYDDSFASTIASLRSRLLSSSVMEQYEWQEEDTLESVLKKFDMTRDMFLNVNPNVDLVFNKGDIVNVVVVKPLVSVQVQRTIIYDEAIPHEVDVSYDPNLWKNKKTVVTEGVDGVAQVTATVLLIDGVEQGREIISEVIVREPITEVVIEGTKEIASTGKYIWPLGDAFFLITDRFYEPRSGTYHRALDIAGWEGSPIFACDAGTVVESNWYGTYGYQILIKHDNGIYTRYAHCSALLVKEGEQVYQGQEIALLGNTGWSTGPHLHLEFIEGGEREDPELFVSIPGE